MGTYLPSEECIKEECARIRSTWSDRERATRYVGRPKHRLGIKVVSTVSAMHLIVQSGIEDAFGWNYLQSDFQVRTKPPTAVTQEEVEDEQLFEEVFVPSTVTFG